MERFAFKIDKVLRANLYKICRLCGIDNPDKVPILRENEMEIVDVDAEPELSQKIRDCVGFLICKDDKMPQMICSLCVDKINDFYEFREMCYATNIQTRKLLGLKDPPKKNTEIKVEVKTELLPAGRGRKRKSEDVPFDNEIKVENEKSKIVNSNASKKKARLVPIKPREPTVDPEKVKTEVKNEPPIEKISSESEVDPKLKQICNICKERFASKYKLDRHKFLNHTPIIPRYVCSTCDETLKKNSDIKSHQLWHKITKTPYTCALCRDTMSSINLYTRHMREHAQKLATPLVVLDRVCGQCNLTFCTNFLYNTHPCSVRTHKCGGCNRQVKNEVDYQRHASTCDKAYLMTSKYLTAALEPVRIKNENDVEAAAESFGVSARAPTKVSTPITTISHNAVDCVDLASANKLAKRSGKKGMSKKDLKRIDDLLKSTMNTLVSIKHEPEMHVDSDVPNHTEQHDHHLATLCEDGLPGFHDDDFQNRDDSSDDGDGSAFIPIVELQTGSEILIKQELNDDENHETATVANAQNVINIKKELPDSGYEDSSATGSIAKVPVLKLKITKEHGTLNSSLVDESPTSREKKKKKKKRKDADKTNEQTDNNENLHKSPIRIKQEHLDDGYPTESFANEPNDYNTDELLHPEATVMTSIPMMQFQIACVSSGVDFNVSDGNKEEQQDIKPNRAELDRWLENNSAVVSTAASGVDPEIETSTTEETNISNMPKPRQNRSTQVKKSSCRSKAVKSTGGISRQDSSLHEMPKIVAVSSGFDAIAAHNDNSLSSHNFTIPIVVVKAEPRDDGYENIATTEESLSSELMETSLPYEDSDQEDTENDEQAYINSIDFSNISIKQEKDIDISESQLTAQQIPANLYNGSDDVAVESVTYKIGQEKNIETDSTAADDTVDGDEDDDEEEEEEEEMELDDTVEREYRELEWPPPLNETKGEVAENHPLGLGLVITSVCSQATEHSDDSNKSGASSRNKNQPTNIDKRNKSPKKTNITEIPPVIGTFTSSDSSTISENALSKSNEEKESNTENVDCAVGSICLKVVETADSLLKTSPNSKSINNESYRNTNFLEENIDEEQQNILNHEVLTNSEMQTNNRLSSAVILNQQNMQLDSLASETHPSRSSALSREQPSVKKTDSSAIFKTSNEETDNFLNENVDVADSRCQQEQEESIHCRPITSNADNLLQQRALLVDNSNINEIAENNNNANIERELLDDSSNNTERIHPPSTVDEDNNDEIT